MNTKIRHIILLAIIAAPTFLCSRPPGHVPASLPFEPVPPSSSEPRLKVNQVNQTTPDLTGPTIPAPVWPTLAFTLAGIGMAVARVFARKKQLLQS